MSHLINVFHSVQKSIKNLTIESDNQNLQLFFLIELTSKDYFINAHYCGLYYLHNVLYKE